MQPYIRDGRAPIPTNNRISRAMSAIRAKHTTPERVVRKLLRENGLGGYKLHIKSIPGRPDIAYPKKRVAIFVHGCFWHGCPVCKPKLPKTHRAFWKAKIERNQERDARKTRELRRAGWRVFVLRECRLKKGAKLPARLVSVLKPRGVSR